MSGSLRGGFCSASLCAWPCRARGSSLVLGARRLHEPSQLPGPAGIHCSTDVSVSLDFWALNKSADLFCGWVVLMTCHFPSFPISIVGNIRNMDVLVIIVARHGLCSAPGERKSPALDKLKNKSRLLLKGTELGLRLSTSKFLLGKPTFHSGFGM